MMVRRSGEVQMNVSGMSVECQVNVESQSELDIGGCETCTRQHFFVKTYHAFMISDLNAPEPVQ